MDDFNKIKSFVVEAGNKALKARNNITAEVKSDGVDLVTNIDKEIEIDFYNLVSKEYPGFGFYGEEFNNLRLDGEYVWCIDPIDGTKYYAYGLPLWTISIGLLKGGKAIYGIVYSPVTDQCYEAFEGQGAFLNGKKLEVSKETDISKITLSWEAPNFHDLKKETQDQILSGYIRLNKKFYRTRNLGSASLSLVYVAHGFFGGYVKYFSTNKQKLDNYAGILIAKEAGAEVFEAILNDSIVMIGGNQNVVSEIRKILQL